MKTDAEIIASLNAHQLAIWEGRSNHTPEKAEQYRQKWRGVPVSSSVNKVELPTCEYLGEATGETAQCRRCRRLEPVPTYHCSKFKLTTLNEFAVPQNGLDIHCCKNCDFNPKNIEQKRKNAEIAEKQAKAAFKASRPLTYVLTESPTDKQSKHGYGPMYDELTAFRSIRAVLEIGVKDGDSLRAWKEAWPDAEVIGVDIVPIEGCVQLDVSDTAALIRFAVANRNRFDLIVDDASHDREHQLNVRRHLIQALKPGGVMVIEDVKDDETCAALKGHVFDFREGHEWDSRAVVIVRPRKPRAMFCSQYLQRDGAPILFANLAKHLRGWDVTVHSHKDGPLRKTLEEAGIPVIIGELDLQDVDLVVANTIVSTGAVEQAKAAGLPCVWLIHESDPAMCGEAIRNHARSLFDYPARVVFPCQATADAYKDFPEHRAEVIPTVIPPVPVRTVQPDPDTFNVLSFGRADDARKGQEDIRKACEALPVYETVNVHLVADADNPHEWMQRANLYVCSSRVEAYPLSLQEAKAYGVPVITTPVFGCAEIIRDVIDGLHYQPGDVTDLRAKILRIMGDNGLRAKLSQPLTHLPSYAETLKRYETLFDGAAGVIRPTGLAAT